MTRGIWGLVALFAATAVAPGTAQAAGATIGAAPTPGSVACVAPGDLQALHLYGLWRAEFDDGERSSVLFERHPEHADSLRGAINRQGVPLRLAGDVDDGDLLLDESDDGQRISAVWMGRAVPEACGREFRGQWRQAAPPAPGDTPGEADREPATRGFVLRRVPGWN